MASSTTQSSSSILLQGGTLLIHDDNDHVVPTRADLLIEGSTITKIAPSIPPSTSPTAKTIDCTNKLISPGFISTHAHLWQTQLKGRHHAHTLVDYMPSGCYAGSSSYTAQDLFWGQLAGALESLDAGTTTVLDHAHLNASPAHPRAALDALATSGLRAVYCYCPRRVMTSANPLVLDEDDAADPRVLDEWEALAAAVARRGGRVSMGFALDALYRPAEELGAIYARLRGAKPRPAQVITTHAPGGVAHGGEGRPAAVGILSRAGVLGPDVLLSHAPGLDLEDVEALAESGAWVSSTPLTEMQMGMDPVAMWRCVLGHGGRRGFGSLGVDCHSWGTSSMPVQMALALQTRRLMRGQELQSVEGGGKWPRRVEGSVEQVFNLGTVAGARAVGMGEEVGRIREGFKADLVVFDGLSPGMLAAAVEDPVAAVVLHSSVRDVEMVIVDGLVRKENGRLCDVTVEEGAEERDEGSREKNGVEIGQKLSWGDVAKELLRSREAIHECNRDVDFGQAVESVIDGWYMDRSKMVSI